MSDRSTSNKPFKGKIEEWETLDVPEAGNDNLGFCIVGIPHGHPDFHNWIRTSLVVKVNDKETPWTVETLNSVYQLGTPDNHYRHYYGVNKPID